MGKGHLPIESFLPSEPPPEPAPVDDGAELPVTAQALAYVAESVSAAIIHAGDKIAAAIIHAENLRNARSLRYGATVTPADVDRAAAGYNLTREQVRLIDGDDNQGGQDDGQE